MKKQQIARRAALAIGRALCYLLFVVYVKGADAMKRCVIVAGGERAPIAPLREEDFLLACDRGLVYALEEGLRPDLILGDFDSYSHRGFECFRALMERYRPAYMIHGHVHLNYGMNVPRKTRFGETTIINAYEHYLIDYKEEGSR